MDQSRSCFWLEEALREIWDRHFNDVPVVNVVNIAYCQGSKSRLGWIALSETGRYTHIGINRLLRFPEVPEAICVVTIAHELVHYAHGFGSPLPQRYGDPHAGGIVECELAQRGLNGALVTYQHWAQHSWNAHYSRFARVRSHQLDKQESVALRSDQSSEFPTVAALDVTVLSASR
jgi:hypothetical protein